MRVLYIGGTGEISQACVVRSVELGHAVTIFNRGRRGEEIPEGVEHLIGDLRDDDEYGRLGERDFDVVCQFLAYDTSTVERDVEVFSGRCAHYVFISTASAYQKPGRGELVTEDTPLENPHWEYSRKKASCEARLMQAAREVGLPVTIVRPSHTYRTRFPSTVVDGDHLAWRIHRDKPVVVHDDGESLWTLTHADDFAEAFARLLGRPHTIGNSFHITSDDAPSWNEILHGVGRTLGKEPAIRAVPSASLIGHEPKWEGPLLGDKAHSMCFDNRRIRSAIGPWECKITLQDGLDRVAGEVAARLESGYRPDPALDRLIDEIIQDQERQDRGR